MNPQIEHPQFSGFTPASVGSQITMPAEWGMISASITNLAEYKVTEYILRHSWTAGNIWMEITTEQFMHGFVYDDGEIGDYGTGLSKPSVIAGLKRAILHGLIECYADESKKTSIRKFYRAYQQEVTEEVAPDENDLYTDVKDLYSTEGDCSPDESHIDSDVKIIDIGGMALEAESACCKDSLPPSSSNSKYYSSNINKNRIRIRRPDFIKRLLEDFSRDLGDEADHIGPNIAQASNLYESSGVSPDEFQEMLHEARERARKASVKKINSRGWPNRMPYYFTVLKGLLAEKQKERQADDTRGHSWDNLRKRGAFFQNGKH